MAIRRPPRRLRLLYLLPDFRADGGAETATANLIAHLDPTLFEVWVAALFGPGPLMSQLAIDRRRLVWLGVRRHGYLLDVAGHARLLRFLTRVPFDIVHTQLFSANTLGRVAARIIGVPVIVTTEQNTYVDKRPFEIAIDRALASVTAQMIAITDAVREFAAAQAGIDPSRFVVVPNAVATERVPRLGAAARRAKRASLGLGPDQPTVISVGRLTEQKGYPVLFRAIRRLALEHPDLACLIVGGGRDAEFRAHARDLGVADRIRFLGLRDDVYELLQSSDVLAMPSLWEGLGVVLLEAGACGVPVVASRIGGIPEVVEHGVNGLLVPPGDDVALAEAIGTLLRSPALRRSIGAAGRRRVEANFSAAAVADRLTRLYLELWWARQGRPS